MCQERTEEDTPARHAEDYELFKGVPHPRREVLLSAAAVPSQDAVPTVEHVVLQSEAPVGTLLRLTSPAVID